MAYLTNDTIWIGADTHVSGYTEDSMHKIGQSDSTFYAFAGRYSVYNCYECGYDSYDIMNKSIKESKNLKEAIDSYNDTMTKTLTNLFKSEYAKYTLDSIMKGNDTLIFLESAIFGFEENTCKFFNINYLITKTNDGYGLASKASIATGSGNILFMGYYDHIVGWMVRNNKLYSIQKYPNKSGYISCLVMLEAINHPSDVSLPIHILKFWRGSHEIITGIDYCSELPLNQ